MPEGKQQSVKCNPNAEKHDYKIPSAPILMGKSDYPTGVLDVIKSKVDTAVIKATKIAEKLGNLRTMNIVLLGALVKGMNLNGGKYPA